MERSPGPCFLSDVSISDFLFNLLRGISKNSVKVVSSCGIVSSDVLVTLEWEGGKETVSMFVCSEGWLREFLRCPGIFDLLSFRRGEHTRRV